MMVFTDGRRMFENPSPGRDPAQASMVLKSYPGVEVMLRKERAYVLGAIFDFAGIVSAKDNSEREIDIPDYVRFGLCGGLVGVVGHLDGVLIEVLRVGLLAGRLHEKIPPTFAFLVMVHAPPGNLFLGVVRAEHDGADRVPVGEGQL